MAQGDGTKSRPRRSRARSTNRPDVVEPAVDASAEPVADDAAPAEPQDAGTRSPDANPQADAPAADLTPDPPAAKPKPRTRKKSTPAPTRTPAPTKAPASTKAPTRAKPRAKAAAAAATPASPEPEPESGTRPAPEPPSPSSPAVLGVEWLAPAPAPTIDPPAADDGSEALAFAVCPTCGRARLGQFRYCLTCGYDFDVGRRTPPARTWQTDIRIDAGIRPFEPPELTQTPPLLTPEQLRQYEREIKPPAPRSVPPTPSPSAGLPVGDGRFRVSRFVLIAGALVVGVVAAVFVSLVLSALGRLF